ncbi:hypothetical protein KQI38_09240 [Tissierella carlieri]|uniref:hypothetical protein n=1 Tax=Tissierella carlieri TaxID=689904 RepID=UPI001C0F440E|nr:hypothetical protein [Tissierella carlieri]MBU5312210.1 hypothetical protein [Tissierella carlieri]
MITQDGMREITEQILNLVSHGEVVVNNETKQIEVCRTNITENTVKILFMLDDTVKGEITSSRVISKTGKVLLDKAEKITKNVTRGLLLVFSVRLTEVEG